MKKLILSFSILFATISQAQWTTDTNTNSVISLKNGGASFSVATSDGKTYVGFWKKVDSPILYELRLQLLDKNGHKLFGEEGKLISNQIPMSSYTMVENTILDKENNLYIGITGSGNGTLAFVYKVTPNGDLPWGLNGIELGEGYLPTILPLSNGEIMISYWPSSKVNARLQKFTSEGKPIWINPSIIYSDEISKSTVPSKLYEQSNGNVVAVFHKITTRNYTNLFAQSFDNKGNTVWEKPVMLSDKTSTWSSKNSSFFENDVIYYAFTSGMAGRSDSYLVRVNSDGSLPWGIGGVDFNTNNAYFEKDIQVASQKGTDHIWAISTYNSASSQNYIGEYVQKFDKKTGQRLFSDNGKEVFPISLNNAKAHIGNLLLDNDKPVFAYDNRKEFTVQKFTTHITRLNSNGEFDLKEETLPLLTRESFKSHHNLVKTSEDEFVLTFNENVDNTETSVYGQNIILPKSDLAINEILDSEFKIYPNPTTSFLYFSKETENARAEIYNYAGQLLKTEIIKDNKVSVEKLPMGNYILRTDYKGKIVNLKFIKK